MRDRWSMRSRPHDGGFSCSPSTPTTVFSSMSSTLGSLANADSCDLLSAAPKPFIASLNVPRIVMPPSACAAAKLDDDTPVRNVTMYSPGIASPMRRSSIDTGTVVDVVDEVVVLVVVVVEVDDVLVVVVVEVDDVLVVVVLDVVDGVEVDVEVDDELEEVLLEDELLLGGTVVDVVEVDVLEDVVEVVVLDELLLGASVVVEDVVDDCATDVGVGSCVSITDMTESASTSSTCGSCFSRRTSALSSDATKPFTFEAKTSLTSLPSAVSLFTFAATLTESLRITM